VKKFPRHIEICLLIIAVCASGAGCLKVKPRVRTTLPSTEYTVLVRADRGWQNSGVRVKAGQIIQCRAEGEWRDHFSSYGPEGDPSVHKKHFGVDAPANALIMKISNQTNIAYYVGLQTNVTAERSGEIRFRKNYSLPIGMEGGIKVKVKVCNDADGDNIADYDEINVWHTNPLSPDSDGDGFSDLDEINDLPARLRPDRAK